MLFVPTQQVPIPIPIPIPIPMPLQLAKCHANKGEAKENTQRVEQKNGNQCHNRQLVTAN